MKPLLSGCVYADMERWKTDFRLEISNWRLEIGEDGSQGSHFKSQISDRASIYSVSTFLFPIPLSLPPTPFPLSPTT